MYSVPERRSRYATLRKLLRVTWSAIIHLFINANNKTMFEHITPSSNVCKTMWTGSAYIGELRRINIHQVYLHWPNIIHSDIQLHCNVHYCLWYYSRGSLLLILKGEQTNKGRTFSRIFTLNRVNIRLTSERFSFCNFCRCVKVEQLRLKSK